MGDGESVRTGSERWITVFRGSMAEGTVCRGLLEANEIPAQILDENIKYIDPFITGRNALDVELQVPSDREAAAREALDYRPPPEEQPEPVEPSEARARKLGDRIRWSSILLVTMPYALWLMGPYLAEVRKLGRRPDGHGWTITAFVMSGVLLVAMVSQFFV